jgi:hypothetical protein
MIQLQLVNFVVPMAPIHAANLLVDGAIRTIYQEEQLQASCLDALWRLSWRQC